MVGTVAGDGAPRSLSIVCSSEVCWTRPFSFYDSFLVVPHPFLLPSFHPSHALCVVFVAECCLLRYCLGFYLNWQLQAMFHNVLQSLTYRQLHVAQPMLQATFYQVQLAEHTCRKSNFLLLHLSKSAASSNPWSKQRLPPRTVELRALGVAN